MKLPGRTLDFRAFMRRSKILSLYRDLLRCVPAPDRHLVRDGFRRHAAERSPAATNMYIAEAERQLSLARSTAARAATPAPAGGAAPPAGAAAPPVWPWQRGEGA